MNDESPSCNVGLGFVHLNTLMYFTFRKVTLRNRIHILSLEPKGNAALIMPAVSMLRVSVRAHLWCSLLRFSIKLYLGPDVLE